MASGQPTSWTSPQAELKAKLERLQQNASHIGVLNSPFFPENISEYIQHKTEFLADTVQETNERRARMQGSQAVQDEINIHHATKLPTEAETTARAQKTAAENRKAKVAFNVLGAPGDTTTIWRPEYNLVPEKRDDSSIWGSVTRASWPDQNEYKAEGEHRLAVFGERRFPLPRRDKLSGEAVKAETDRGVPIEALAGLKGGDVPFYRREIVEMTGLDKLESLETAKNDPRKTYNLHGVIIPSRLTSGQNNQNGQPPVNARYTERHNNKGGGQIASSKNQHDLGGMSLGGHKMMANSNEQQSGPAAAQRSGRPDGMMGGHGNKDLGAPNPGFATSANRAISGGGRRGRRQRAGRGDIKSGGSMTATSAQSALQESVEEKATTVEGDKEDNVNGKNAPDHFEEFKSEEEYMQAKGFGHLLDEM